MEKTLVILKPSAMLRGLAGEVISRFEKKGLIIIGMKMMTLSDEVLREHYAHLAPVVVMCLKGLEAVDVVRKMTGATRGRHAELGTIRGDLCMSGQQNIVHASDSVENAKIEIQRFFKPEEITDYETPMLKYLYADDEL